MRHVTILCCFLCLSAWPRLVRAEGATEDSARAEAKERFSRGLHLFEGGDNGGALAEFKRAYELIPNRLVLYNIALVYASMGKPVEAADSLDKVLADPGPLKSEYLAHARETREEQDRRIGQLEVRVNVPAVVEVDGVKAGDAPLVAPLRVAAGEHIIGALAPGYLPIRQTTSVPGAARASLSFELLPTEAKLAHVEILCPVPAADVFVDGILVGKTPLSATVAVAPGTRAIEVRRAGYSTARRELTISDGARGQVALDLDQNPQSSGPRGRLRLQTSDTDVLLTIDGRAHGVYRQPVDLPAGSHFVKLEQAGFEAMERATEVPANGEAVVRLALRPTVETRAVSTSHARSVRHWAYGTLIGGAVVAGISTGLALWGNNEYSSSQTRLVQAQAANRRWSGTDCDPSKALTDAKVAECNQAVSNAQNDVDTYRSLRTWGIVGAVAGAVAAAVGVTLWLTGPDPNRGEDAEGFAGSVVPVVAAGPGGATLSLRGRF
jgi:hypothetical protein